MYMNITKEVSMKKTDKISSLMGSLIIAFMITLLLPSMANAKHHGSHGSKNHGSSDSCECSGGITSLTLRYNGTTNALVEIYGKKDEVIFSETLSPNEKFIISGTGKHGRLNNQIDLYVNDNYNTGIHTSCSKPIEVGMDFGNFTITDGYSRKGGQLCTVPQDTQVYGVVYEDVNENGLKDSNETGQAGIQVKICYTKSGNAGGHGSHNHGSKKHGSKKHGSKKHGSKKHGSNNHGGAQPIEACVVLTTDAQGNYSTNEVPEGSATVTVIEPTLPAGAELTAGENPNTITVEAHQNNDAREDGYTLPPEVGSIKFFIFEDVNENGAYDNEDKGIPNVSVTIVDSENNTHNVESNAMGMVLVDLLPLGTVNVTVDDNDTDLSGYIRTSGTSTVTAENLANETLMDNHGFVKISPTP